MERDHPTGPAYRIHTSRLVLRCWEPHDAPLLKEAVDASVDHLRPWMPWAENEPEDLGAKVKWLRQCRGNFDLDRDFVYGIFSRDEQMVLGSCGLHTGFGEKARAVGYWIHKDFINQGFASEATAALTKVAFEIDKVVRVEIHCDPANLPSAAVPGKLGFTHEATLRKRLKHANGCYHDTMIWTMLTEEYPTSAETSVRIEAFDGMGRQIL